MGNILMIFMPLRLTSIPGARPLVLMNLPAACKMEHDAIGHYARPDVLELKVNEK